MLFDAARRNQLEFLLEIVVSLNHQHQSKYIVSIVDRIYSLGIKPDWWKLEPLTTVDGWRELERLINSWDSLCRGVLLLGLDQPIDVLGKSFELAAKSTVVKGFAVGRSIFGEIAKDWFSDRLTDAESVRLMGENFQLLCDKWNFVSQHRLKA